jgi:murein DD-endopeptidase MepM/ murein hydrolase activator NlpD
MKLKLNFEWVLPYRSRRRSLNWAIAGLLSMTGIGAFLPSSLQAQYTPTATRQQNPWQSASFPVENFQAYTSGYGYRSSPVDGSSQFHYGLDLAAPIGSYVRSWWTGQVVELSDNTACGTMIKIQSGDWQHVYCHLMGRVQSDRNTRYLVDREGGIVLQLGQQVPAGARIARVGMSGRTTGPHLHWGLKYANNYLDPALVLQAMFTTQAKL